MGNCCDKTEDSPPPQSSSIEYLKTNTLGILVKNPLGKTISIDKLTFNNTSPLKIESTQGNIGKKPVKIHGAILPGTDPRGETIKECQDDYTFILEETHLLCALFDGHGKQGQQIAKFLTSFISKFHKKNSKILLEHPEETLINMLHKCDEKLKKSKIRDDLAGATAVSVLITEYGVHSASLGDSRAIISTFSEQETLTPQRKGKYFKKVTPKRHLKPVPLTTDQKPNHGEEFARIKASGGVVEQLKDIYGNRVGPYRVWLAGKDLPGLAMSRSIGDRIAKKIGVISTPVCHNFQLFEADQFIVIASDGVWDVMENIEVINFVDSLKNDCKNSSDLFPARPENSSIARLLCEEARYRWFDVIEDEDVIIDDISCIVIDLQDIQNSFGAKAKERKAKAFQSLAITSMDVSHTAEETDEIEDIN